MVAIERVCAHTGLCAEHASGRPAHKHTHTHPWLGCAAAFLPAYACALTRRPTPHPPHHLFPWRAEGADADAAASRPRRGLQLFYGLGARRQDEDDAERDSCVTRQLAAEPPLSEAVFETDESDALAACCDICASRGLLIFSVPKVPAADADADAGAGTGDNTCRCFSRSTSTALHGQAKGAREVHEIEYSARFGTREETQLHEVLRRAASGTAELEQAVLQRGAAAARDKLRDAAGFNLVVPNVVTSKDR